jgi:hypothetical protein
VKRESILTTLLRTHSCVRTALLEDDTEQMATELPQCSAIRFNEAESERIILLLRRFAISYES